MKKFFSLTALALTVAGTLAMAPVRAEDAKPIEVHVCPMQVKAVKGAGAGNEVVGKYKVFFCCGGCQGEFDKLSDADKQKKAEVAFKTQEDAKKKG